MAHYALENLTFTYPGAASAALRDVSLTIERGSFTVLCGKSGCGKTTLLRHLKPVLTPHGVTSGRILFDGMPLSEVPAHRQSAEIGFVMQDPDAQLVTDKVWHEMAFGLENLGVDERVMRLRVAEMASFFGIEGWFHEDVDKLSGGQKQLLNLASIMAMQPSVLVLDEPTSQLDPIAAADFINTVEKVNRELGVTVVITEHCLDDVFPRADRVIVMDGGRVIADGEPRAVGEGLLAQGHDMALALPAPLRIAHAIESHSPDVAARPLTVREGRLWLSRHLGGGLPARTALPDAGNASDRAEMAIELKNVWLRYERDLPDVLRGVTLGVPRGSVFAVMGGNGAGKSTMLKAIAGVERPYRGSVRIGGRKAGVRGLFGRKAAAGSDGASSDLRVSLLPQDPQNLFGKDTVREELAETAVERARDREAAALASEEMACRMGIAHLMDAHPYDLSCGEQQRVALAKILLVEPDILLLDEPTKGLDAFCKRSLAEDLANLKAGGVTVLMVSHDLEFCASCADVVSLFFNGEVVTTAAPRRFFSSNAFYTTVANRMSRHVFDNAIVEEDVIELCAGAGEGLR